MKNFNAPIGLKPNDTLTATLYNGKTHRYIISASDTSELYQYDAVKMTGDSNPDGIPYVTKCTETDQIVGSVVSIRNIYTQEEYNWRAPNKELYIYVLDDPFAEFVAQTNGTMLSTYVGKQANLVISNGDKSVGISHSQIDLSTLTDGNGQVKILGIEEVTNNSLGLYSKVRCMIADHQLKRIPTDGDSFWDRNSMTNTLVPQVPTDNISTQGNISADGNLDIGGKLTVGGLIDPTGLVLTPQTTAPATDNGTLYYDSATDKFYFRENGAWVTYLSDFSENLWDRSVDGAGYKLTQHNASDNVDLSSAKGYLRLPSGTNGEQPTPANGMARYNTSTNLFEFYQDGSWENLGGGGSISLSAVGTSPNANAATLTGSTLNLEPADATNPGVVTASSQTFGGNKTGQFTFNANANAGGFKITNLLPGVDPTDAATVSQIIAGSGEKDYDATVGVGGDYATIQLALTAGKYKILILDNYTETANIIIPNQGTYYFYAKKSVNLGTYSIEIYPSGSSDNIIYFSGIIISNGRLFTASQTVSSTVSVHYLPGCILNQSGAALDASGIIVPTDPAITRVSQTFYSGSSYLLPPNDTTPLINTTTPNTITIFNNSSITFPGTAKNFGSFGGGTHSIQINGGLTSYGNIGSLSALTTFFTINKLDGFLDFRNTVVTSGALFTIATNQTSFGSGQGNDNFGQIMGPINIVPVSATAYSYTNASLNLAEQPSISNTSQVGNSYPRSIYATIDESGVQISNLAAHVLTISGSNNNIASYRSVGSIPLGAIIDKTSPKSAQSPYGLGGVSIVNPGSGIAGGGIAFAPSGGTGTGSWFSAVVSGGQITTFNSFGNPQYASGYRYGSYITGSGYTIGDPLYGVNGIELQVLNVYDGYAITITGSNNFVRVIGSLDGIKITGNNNIIYVPSGWAGIKSDTGTGNKIIVGVKDVTVYTIEAAPRALPNVFVDEDGTLTRTTENFADHYGFKASLGTSQVNVTGDSTWVTYIFDTQVADVGTIYNPVTGQFGSPFKCLAYFGANVCMTNAVSFPAASDYGLEFVRKNSLNVEQERVGFTDCKCTNSVSNISPQKLTDNISCFMVCWPRWIAALQGWVTTIGLKTVSFYASATEQQFWGDIVIRLD